MKSTLPEWLVSYPQLRLFFDGMLCMMALYAIFSYFQHRKPIYWQYAFYIICMVITFYFDDIDYGKADYLPGTNFKVAIIESLAFLLYIRFAILLMEIPKLDPFSHSVLKILVIILCVEMAVDLAFMLADTSATIKSNTYIVFRCVLAVGALIVVPRILKVRQAAASYFIVGSMVFILGCITSLACNFIPDIFTRNPALPYTYPIAYMEFGVILEVLCFTLGMSVLNRKNELEKIQMQEQLIEQLCENTKKQSDLQRIRDDISRDLHDELGADLGSISVMSHVAMKQLRRGEIAAEETITTIGETSRKVIARMREIIWSLHSAHDSVGNFSFRLKETTYALIEHHPIEVHFSISDDDLDMQIPNEYRRNLFLVFKEILHNIIRHAKARNVYINVFIENGQLNLVVKDDGVGFALDTVKVTGNGLINLQQRTDTFGGSLKIESQPEKGTSVTVLCPVDNSVAA
jgi:signal transduction histidine kinase